MGAMLSRSAPHLRRSIRLPAYDYADPGAYFVTICANNRQYLFGEVVADEMRLNELGCIAQEEWLRTSAIRKEIELDAFQVMPNHLHAVAMITASVGAHGRALLQGVALQRASKSLGALVAGFKSSTTKRINAIRKTPGQPVWQRNYYERVVRDEDELGRIREYILRNPAQWALDRENPLALHDPARWPERPNRDAIESLFFA